MDPRAEAALRGMIAHTDERFQTLSTRVASMEDTLEAMTNATRELRAAISHGAAIRVEGGNFDGAGISELKAQVADLERHLAAAFEYQAKQEAENRTALAEAIEDKIAEVTSKVSEQVEAIKALDRPSGEVIAGDINIDTDQLVEAFEERVVRLASLIRSDSIRLAEVVESQRAMIESLALSSGGGGGGAGDANLAQLLESRLGRVSELVSATTMSAVAEVARQVPEQAKAALDERMTEVMSSIDENFVELANVSETELHRMGRYMSERTAELVDAAVAGRLSATLERITAAAEAVEAAGASGSGLGEAAIADITAIVDDRVVGLAKMVRSDNKRLADEVAAQQEVSKQTTRAVKELAAALPAQIMEVVDRRFAELSESLHHETQSTIVAVAKAADVVSERIGEVEDRYSSGVERAAERLGDAVANALAAHRGAV